MKTDPLPAAPARIADVARLAGVSTATVSRVLSRPEMVTEETRQAVMQAVRETGYRMNHAARNLRKGRTGAVVALVPNLGNPFFAKILSGMGRELAAHGYDLLVGDTQAEGGRHLALRRFLDPSRADGIVLLDGLVQLSDLADLAGAPPVVTACEWIEGSAIPRIVFDNEAGTALAAQHLRDLGHLRIGCIGGPALNVLHRSRLAGMRRVLDDAFTCFDGDFTLEAGQRAAHIWLQMSAQQRPTGIVAFSDEMACAFIAELRRHGVSVPQDVSVVGFDDIELVSHFSPALTTIRQPKREIGRRAAETVLALIEGRNVTPVTTLPPQLMLRGSTASAADLP